MSCDGKKMDAIPSKHRGYDLTLPKQGLQRRLEAIKLKEWVKRSDEAVCRFLALCCICRHQCLLSTLIAAILTAGQRTDAMTQHMQLRSMSLELQAESYLQIKSLVGFLTPQVTIANFLIPHLLFSSHSQSFAFHIRDDNSGGKFWKLWDVLAKVSERHSWHSISESKRRTGAGVGSPSFPPKHCNMMQFNSRT